MQLLLAGEHSTERWIQPNHNCIHFKLIWVAICWIDSFHLIGIVRKVEEFRLTVWLKVYTLLPDSGPPEVP
jgi:hypothetical protein